jgi:transposase InsO family protein
MIASMSRNGDCWDNAVAESFFATIRAELIEHEVYATHAAAIAAIGDHIDGFYTPQRRHSSLGYVSPMEFELRLQSRSGTAQVRLSTTAARHWSHLTGRGNLRDAGAVSWR